MKIGVYGGTFNPIHYGHLRTAEEVFEKLSLDKVLFIPAGRTPLAKPELVKAGHRYSMVKLAAADNPHFEISDVEIKTGGKSFTVDTIRKLGRLYAGSELFFILGLDAFLDLPNWKQPDELLNLTNVVVISRPRWSFTGLLSSPYLKSVSGRALKELDNKKRDLVPFDISEKKKGFLCRVTGLDISASNIRNLIMSGESVRYLLPDSVENYIISHKLYKKEVRSRK
ncbi:MAG: nicotinate (nicotinamide) nucleotide adenylyltransferase [Nitrospirae bacterium]|nr:nicotinate (nicotinamide) nucleotide adenylyltransferase [Nitrospirota bacterium]